MSSKKAKSTRAGGGWHALSSSRNDAAMYVRPGGAIQAELPAESFPTLSPVKPLLPSEQKPAQQPAPAKTAWQRPVPHTSPRQAPLAGQAETRLLQQLIQQHPWAERDLVQAVLLAIGNAPAIAQQVLSEMEQYISGSDSDEEISHLVHGLTGDAAHPPGPTQAHTRQPARAAPPPPQQAAQTRQALRARQPRGLRGLSEEEQLDVYMQHRQPALRLSQRWQRLMRRSGSAYAAGDHSEARRLAAEAQRLRGLALQAHAQAAQRILHDSNQGRGLGLLELDLHGLHAAEAVAALDDRLALIHSQPHDRLDLRVITGKGNHSSGTGVDGGGDASLPRVIESHLIGLGSAQFLKGRGFFTVQLPSSTGG